MAKAKTIVSAMRPSLRRPQDRSIPAAKSRRLGLTVGSAYGVRLGSLVGAKRPVRRKVQASPIALPITCQRGAAVGAPPLRNQKFADSPLEGGGFELVVPDLRGTFFYAAPESQTGPGAAAGF